MSCHRKRCPPKCNKCCHREFKPYPPEPKPPKIDWVTIPIIALADVPSANTVPNGAIILVGQQQPRVSDPANMPNPVEFSVAVANGCYWNMMAAGALGCDPMPPEMPPMTEFPEGFF